MSYPQIVLDIAKSAVDTLKTIVVLKSQLISSPINETEVDINRTINNNIRTQQKILKDNNIILRSNNTQTLLESNTKFDTDGNVIGPWEFSYLIEGTRQYITNNTTYENISIVQNNENIQIQQNDVVSLIPGLSPEYVNINVNDIERTKGINEITTTTNISQLQAFRKSLEDEIRDINDQLLTIMSQISNISLEISKTTDPSELSVLMQQLSTYQNEYELLNKTKKSTESILTQFLNSTDGQLTTVSSGNIPPIVNITEDESVAVRRLRQQYIDAMNQSTTIEDKDAAYTNLINLDHAIKSNNIDRISLTSPDETKLEAFNVQMNELINERNNLQYELSVTDPTDTIRIAEINLQVNENEINRYTLSKNILGLQDLLGYGIKVNVEKDNSGNPKLIIYDVQNATYEVNEVYYTDLTSTAQVIKETNGILDAKQYEMLKFVTATSVYDAKKGKIIARPTAETGQESRYVVMRPLLQDSIEYIEENGLTPLQNYRNNIQMEIEKLQADYENSIEYKTFIELNKAMNDFVYDTFVKNTDNQIIDNNIEIQKTLIEIGISDVMAAHLTSINVTITSEEFVTAITSVLGNNITPEIQQKLNKLNELQNINTTLNNSVNKYRSVSVGVIDFGDNIGNVFALDAEGNTLHDVVYLLEQQTFILDIGE